MSKIRVVVVDDSATMRGLISATLNRDPNIEVVGGAGDPYQARELIKQLNPDVITLDVEMPKMDGISFLEKIMRLRPMPVIMVSTLTEKGAKISIEALQLGAFDCVCKPLAGDKGEAFAELADLVKAAARSGSKRHLAAPSSSLAVPDDYQPNGSILAIGSSTGGVEALTELLTQFPENCPPTVITQHMPASFTKSFAARLNGICAPQIAEATDGAPLDIGRVYIAPGGNSHLEVKKGVRSTCKIVDGDLVSGHRPSVDVLFRSVSEHFRRRAVGVILTGMGKDGAKGLLTLRDGGAKTFGQDEASCVVYGMPRVAHEMGAVEKQLPLSKIAKYALNACSGRRATKAA